MKKATEIATALANKIDAAGIFSANVVVDSFSRWEESGGDMPPTIQLVSVKKEKLDRSAVKISYAFLLRRATLNIDNLSSDNLDAVSDLFNYGSRYIPLTDDLVYFSSFTYNAPTRTTTNGVTLNGAYDSVIMERDAALLQTAIIEVYRVEDRTSSDEEQGGDNGGGAL